MIHVVFHFEYFSFWEKMKVIDFLSSGKDKKISKNRCQSDFFIEFKVKNEYYSKGRDFHSFFIHSRMIQQKKRRYSTILGHQVFACKRLSVFPLDLEV